MKTKKHKTNSLKTFKKILFSSLGLLTFSTLICSPLLVENNDKNLDYSAANNSFAQQSSESTINFDQGPIWLTSYSYNTYAFIDTNGDDSYDEIWGWGKNTYGQLGNSSTTDQLAPLRLDTIWTFENGKKITNFIQTSNTTFAFVDATGDGVYDEIWGWGYNNHGVLGINYTTDQSTPLRLDTIWTFENGKTIIDIKVNAFSVFAFVSTDGNNSTYEEIWGWGYNGYGQLGINSTNDQLVPLRLDTIWTFENGKKITNFIPTFYTNFVFVDATGDGIYDEIWGWGFNILGVNSYLDQIIPLRLDTIWTFEDGKKIINFIATPYTAFAFVDANSDGIYDEIWGWGYNDYGQLGDNSTTDQWVPLRLDAIWTFEDGKKITKIEHAFVTNFAFVDNNGDGAYDEIWGWGYNESGVLGVNSNVDQLTPIRLDDDWTFEDGKIINFTLAYETIFAFVDANGDGAYDEIWGWGSNTNGALGIGNSNNVGTPIRLDLYWGSSTSSISNTTIDASNGNVTYNLTSTSSGLIIPGINDAISSNDFAYTIYDSTNIAIVDYTNVKFIPTLENGLNIFTIQNFASLNGGNYTLEIKINENVQTTTQFTIKKLNIANPTIAITEITHNSVILNYTPLKIGETSYYSFDGGTTWTPFIIEADGTTLITGLTQETQYNLIVSDDQIFTTGIDYEMTFSTITRILPSITNVKADINPTSIIFTYNIILNDGWITSDLIEYSLDGGATTTLINLNDFSDGSFEITNLTPSTNYSIEFYFNTELWANYSITTPSTISTNSDFTSNTIDAKYSDEKLTFNFYYEDPNYSYLPSLTLTNSTIPVNTKATEELILNLNGIETSISSGVPIELNQTNGLISGQMNEVTISGFLIDSTYVIELIADNGATPVTINVNDGVNSFVATQTPTRDILYYVILSILIALALTLFLILIYYIVKNKNWYSKVKFN